MVEVVTKQHKGSFQTGERPLIFKMQDISLHASESFEKEPPKLCPISCFHISNPETEFWVTPGRNPF